ncbi:SurA N-terminal domain-containing protein [Nonomuraea angiospora]|uniref:Peptidyl-prolyl cis-trans isomerase SurA n=1 Tax=Nonomuraea angiospora TaxID=46172 RepID=A0ABR9M5Z9_9ACTN|nr:SurA N-terminal domain-containing protein [Nonomuraea angiospora]MBE1587726.1 peptidyl-prolyl cis-trans isomerase SurA [Nonomuraea angiospora]
MKSIRVAVAAAAVGIALTACSSPMQAGAAAVVGKERISTGQLNRDAEAYKAALKQNKLDETALGVPVTQYVLQRLADISAARQLMARNNVQVTDKEIDAKLQDPGQYQSPQINLLALGVAPSYARDYARTAVGMAKLQQQAGQAGLDKLRQDFASIKTTFNPRFGVVNTNPSQENPSLFVDAGRFGKATSQQAQQQQPQG